jgi:soluble lytic murein transglycosylase-like protein
LAKLFLFLAVAGVAWGAEFAVLRSGFEVRVDRHEEADGVVRLYTAGGVIEVPVSEISEFVPAEKSELLQPESVTHVTVPAAPVVRAPRELVDEAARRYGLPPELLHSVARVESAYRVDAVSPKGAIGIMQLMPGTAAALEADPRDPEQNVDAGARHLRDLLVRYGGATGRALAAYNAGAGAVRKYNGIPPYQETQLYVEKVLRNYWRLAGQAEK